MSGEQRRGQGLDGETVGRGDVVWERGQQGRDKEASVVGTGNDGGESGIELRGELGGIRLLDGKCELGHVGASLVEDEAGTELDDSWPEGEMQLTEGSDVFEHP